MESEFGAVDRPKKSWPVLFTTSLMPFFRAGVCQSGAGHGSRGELTKIDASFYVSSSGSIHDDLRISRTAAVMTWLRKTGIIAPLVPVDRDRVV